DSRCVVPTRLPAAFEGRMSARAAARAVLIVALIGLRSGSAAMDAQQQTVTQPSAGEGQKPAAPPAGKKAENDDLDLIPTPQSPADAEPAVSRNGNQRMYVENALTASIGRSNLLVPVPQSTATSWQERVFVDVRREWHAGRRLTLTLSDRLNVRAEHDLAFPSRQNIINDWREGFFSWEAFDNTYVDAGRINLKSGAALGFNPTDFFKTRDVVEPLSSDPSVLREDRLGTLMLRGQRIWAGGTMTVAFAPAVSQTSPIYSATRLPSVDPSFDRTNARARLLVTGSVNVAADFSPELLVYHEGNRTRFGVNVTQGIGQNVVAYAEWTGGVEPGVIEDALAYGRDTRVLPVGAPSVLPDDSASTFREDLSVGGSFSTRPKLTLNVEYHFHQAGFDKRDWERWFMAGEGTTSASLAAGELWLIRSYALDRQDPLTRHSLFARADWVDALIRHLELTGFVNMDIYDRSNLAQLTADYFASSKWTVGVQASANIGRVASDFGSLSQRDSILFKFARYFSPPHGLPSAVPRTTVTHSTTLPPLRLTTVPVIPLAWSDATKAAALASSSSVVRRLRCVPLSIRARYSAAVMPAAVANFSKFSRIVAVSGIALGIRHTTRTPCGASSAESVRLSPTTPATPAPPPPTSHT